MCCRKDVVTPNISVVLPTTTNTQRQNKTQHKEWGVVAGKGDIWGVQIEGYLRNPNADDGVSYTSYIVCITHEYECTSNQMMRQHLPKILPPSLDIQHKHLLQPKRQFHKIIRLKISRILNLRIFCPHFRHIPPIGTFQNNP